MSKRYVIFNPDNSKYFTGRLWGEEWAHESKDAKWFSSEVEIDIFTKDILDEDNNFYDVFAKVGLVEIRTIYVK